MSDNWVVQNLQNALDTWNKYLTEIWQLIAQSPAEFKGGAIWGVILNIHDAIRAVGLALLVLFFLVGVMRTCGSFAEMRRPEVALKLFVRFALAKGVVTYGLELMLALFDIIQGLVSTILNASGLGAAEDMVLPEEIVTAVEDCGFFRVHPPVGRDAYRRAVHHGAVLSDDPHRVRAVFPPVPVHGHRPGALSTFAGEPTQNVGKSFLKSYAAVCLEGAIIVLACVIFSLFAAAPPVVDADAAAVTQVWSYIGELIFNMLVLVGSVKMADRIVREMMGL